MTGKRPGSAFPHTVKILQAYLGNAKEIERATGHKSLIFSEVKRELGILMKLVESGMGDHGLVAHEGVYDIMHPRASLEL